MVNKKNTKEWYHKKLRPFIQYLEKEGINPDENIIDSYFGETKTKFRTFVILYCFYYYSKKKNAELFT